jgi:hypothetical protein
MSDTTNTVEQVPQDDDYVGELWFSRELYVFFHEGLKKLRSKITAFEEQFNAVKDKFELKESPIADEISHIDHMIDWGEEKLSKSTGYRLIVRVYYGDLRMLKAGGILQIREVVEKRDEFIRSQAAIPTKVLSAIENRIRRMRDMVEQGKLNGVKPADIFLELDNNSTDGKQQAIEARELSPNLRPIVVELGEIPIMDSELRSRCLGILKTRTEEGDDSQLDTVVREMSAVLENRIREVAEITDRLSGLDLTSAAFAGSSPRLVFSSETDIQNAAHLLFRGYIGFYRNETMHKLVKTYTRDRVYQLLAYVDQLLFLLTQAQKPTSSTPATTP